MGLEVPHRHLFDEPLIAGIQARRKHVVVRVDDHAPPPVRSYVTAQGLACSNAALAAITVSSANRRPATWSPTGSPSVERPAGIDAAGCPVKLNGYVRHQPSRRSTLCPSISPGPSVLPSRALSTGSAARVGHTRRSYRSNTSCRASSTSV